MTIILQASLLCKPSLSLVIPPPHPKRHRFHHSSSPPPRRHRHRHFYHHPNRFFHCSSTFTYLCFRSLRPSIPCTLHPDNVESQDSKFFNNSGSDFRGDNDNSNALKLDSSEVPNSNFQETANSESSGNELKVEETNGGGSLGKSEGVGESSVGNEGAKSKIPLLVFLMGLWTKMKRGIEKMMTWDWFSWWPFWRQEKRLEQLIAEANANSKDVGLQSALLAELNKHRFNFSSFIICFVD